MPLQGRFQPTAIGALIVVLIPAALAFFTLSPTVYAQDSAHIETIAGRSFQLNFLPAWTFFGCWDTGGDSFILVDTLRSQVLRYSSHGTLLDDIAGSASLGGTTITKPSVIIKSSSGLIIEDEDGKLVWLDSAYRQTKTLDLLDIVKNKYEDLESVWGWVPQSKELLVLGDLKSQAGWYTALLRVPFQEPSDFEVLQRIEISDPARSFYLLGNMYLAVLGEKSYFLSMTDYPSILEFGNLGTKPRILSALKEMLSVRPLLPEKRGVGSVRELFRAVERSTMPVSLYGWKDYLYGLVRENSDDQTHWVLVKIDPRADRIVRKQRIETQAKHVVLIPGPDAWLLVEKGSVLGLGQQSIDGVRLLPSDLIK